MVTSNKISCFIIGEGTLPIQCAQILLDREHTIYGMISSDVAVQHWAREREIPHIDPKNKDIVTFLSQHPFDYLFSIVNMNILPKGVLALPRRCAINFHDAPLPRYAGRYATSWTIMQSERVHGVTWHTMDELVDAGDIFKQALFEIGDGETAFTLNTKCYDAAIRSFAELIDDIAYDRVSARKQNLDERTFFSQYKRPSSGCILSWNRSARDIGAFVRALDFGSYPNPLGLPKLAIGKDVIIVPEVEVLNAMPAVPPGTVTQLAPGFVKVSTKDGEIALRKLLTIDGQSLPIADFVAKFGLYEGYQFKELDQEAATRITACNASICQHEAFWTKQLETLENISLPYAHRKTSSVPTAQSLYVPMPIPKEIINLLENHYTTEHREDVLLAAFAAYLARIAGVWSFTIGYRDIELERDVADLEGIFAAYVPLHVSMEYEQSFKEAFHAVQEQVKQAKQRKTYARDIMARYPTLHSKANLQGAHLPSIFVERVEALHDYIAPHSSELTLVILEGGAECLWVYNAEALDEESIVEMKHGFTTFLHGIASHPQQRISHLPLLAQRERHRLLVEWNATHAEYPMDKCLHQLFEAQVEHTPDAVAVSFEDEHLTYRQLNGKANQLAHHLQKLGVGPEVLVGMCVERSLEMVVGLLGILKAGGAYVPLDPAFPSERLAFMLEDAQAPVLVTQQYLLTRLSAHGTKVVYLDADAATLARQSEANPVSGTTSGHLAYVIYTSGSTGRPKGVQILHRAVVNFLLSMREQPGLMARDTWLAITTLSFDIAALELFLPLIVGARSIVASRDTAADGTALAETLTRAGVTVMQATPVTWRLLLAAGWPGKSDLKILCGGEALPPDLAQRLLPRAASLWNLYGPTETTIWSTLCKIEPGDDVVTIGRPIANTQIYLLDPQLQPVPVDVPGELYIGGDGLARGYLNRPELTAERFIPHPFSNEPGTRLYRTGDLARYRPDGTVEHLGRLDYQVKLRGFRIELGEIETVLAQHPAVRQAAVVAREDVPGDKRLVGYLVTIQEPPPAISELRSFLKERLPEYMLPSAFVFLEAFPLTPNGKVDRRALPAPATVRREQIDAYVAPRTPTEEILASIWAQVLHLARVGIHDDFFVLGGDSLMAMQVLAHLRRALQIKLALHHFFEARTIAQLTAVIEEMLMDKTKMLHGEEAQGLTAKQDQQELHNLQVDDYLQPRAPVKTVQTGKLKQPFFYLHGDWTGGAFYCITLARALGSEQPFYALEPYRVDGLDVPATVEAMAAAHLKSIRAIQPEGPYFLGGFCSGGLLAYEMTRQLHTEGQRVDLLVLIEPHPAGHLKRVRGVISRFGDLTRLSQDKQLDLFLRLRHAARHLYRHMPFLNTSRVEDFWQLLALEPRLATMFPPVEALRKDFAGVFNWLASAYLPDYHYPGKIAFFWASEGHISHSIRSGWPEVTGDTVVEVYLPGTHLTCITTYIHVLAKHLRTYLSEVQVAVWSK